MTSAKTDSELGRITHTLSWFMPLSGNRICNGATFIPNTNHSAWFKWVGVDWQLYTIYGDKTTSYNSSSGMICEVSTLKYCWHAICGNRFNKIESSICRKKVFMAYEPWAVCIKWFSILPAFTFWPVPSELYYEDFEINWFVR